MKQYCIAHELCNCTRQCGTCGGNGFIKRYVEYGVHDGLKPVCHACHGAGRVQFRDCRKNYRGKRMWVVALLTATVVAAVTLHIFHIAGYL